MADRRGQRTRHDQLVLLDGPYGPAAAEELLAVPAAEASGLDDAALDGLTAEQRAAVAHVEGPLLILSLIHI